MENHGGSPGRSRGPGTEDTHTDGSTSGRRTQAQRDAMTVEIGYALLSAAFVAAVAFGTVAGPALFLDLSDTTVRALVMTGVGTAVLVFAVRVVTVLVRFGHEADAQPSQPGRTSPDS
ncbi:hypothetical protein GCM10023335_78060 [Streptomyces siamensis]|uniref:AtpZ/AtpI family protein n=2 Tax=Streptomyces siamensis TaxID=1274986 RepID=A0ABP9JJ98_9ACTN